MMLKISGNYKRSFFEGIKYAVKGNRIGDISHAIGEFVEKMVIVL